MHMNKTITTLAALSMLLIAACSKQHEGSEQNTQRQPTEVSKVEAPKPVKVESNSVDFSKLKEELLNLPAFDMNISGTRDGIALDTAYRDFLSKLEKIKELKGASCYVFYNIEGNVTCRAFGTQATRDIQFSFPENKTNHIYEGDIVENLDLTITNVALSPGVGIYLANAELASSTYSTRPNKKDEN